MLLNLPTTVFVARGLGPADKGLWTLCVQSLSVGEVVAAMGGGTYFALVLRQGRSLPDVYAASVLHAILLSMTTLAIGAAVGLPSLLPPEASSVWLVAVFGCTLILLVANHHMAFMWLGVDRPGVASLYAIIGSIVQLLLVVVVFASGHFNLPRAIMCWAAGIFVTFACSAIHLARVVRVPHWPQFDMLRGALAFGWKRMVYDLQDVLTTRMALFLLPLFLPLSTLGVYSIALGIVEVLGQLGLAVSRASLGHFGSVGYRAAAYLSRTTVLAASAMSLICIPIGLVLPTVFGKGYESVGSHLFGLLLTVPALALCRLLSMRLCVAGRVTIVGIGGTLSLGSLVALMTLLTPGLGPAGATLSLWGSLSVQGTVLLIAAARHDGVRVREMVIPRYEDLVRVVGALGRLPGRILALRSLG